MSVHVLWSRIATSMESLHVKREVFTEENAYGYY